MLRMARDLVAKRAVERYIQRKACRSRRGPFNCLGCCHENESLKDQIVRSEQQLSRQNSEVKEAHNARSEEVLQLGAEVVHLREQLQSCSSLRSCRGLGVSLPRGGTIGVKLNRGTKEQHIQLENDLMRSALKIEQLHKQLMEQRVQIEDTRRHMFEALRQVAGHRGRLAVAREVNKEDMAQLRRHFLPSSNQAPDAVNKEVSLDISRDRDRLAECGIQVECLLSQNRIAQSQERVPLEEELRTIHEKVNSELSHSSRVDAMLGRQCAALHARASEILCRFSAEQHMPTLPSTIEDLGAQSAWLQALGPAFENLVRCRKHA